MTKKQRTKKRFFSYTAGEKGRNRVRVYQKSSGLLMLEYYEQAMRRRVSLGHHDEGRAKREADQIAVQLRGDQRPTVERDITIQQLFDIYEREMTPGKSPSKQAHDRRCGAMFRRYFGSKCHVATLSILDWNRFLRDRGAGRIGPRHGANKPAGPRQIQYDLKHLRAVLQWATLSRVDGRPLLERNPLAGLPLPREDSPKRPVMDQPYYELLLAIAPQVDWRFHGRWCWSTRRDIASRVSDASVGETSISKRTLLPGPRNTTSSGRGIAHRCRWRRGRFCSRSGRNRR